MAFIIDDIAAVAAEVVESVEAVSPVDAISETAPSAEANDVSKMSKTETKVSDTNDTDGVDDMPDSEGMDVANENPNDTNVFYDECPDEISSETTEATENTTTPATEQQSTTYEELSETRKSGGSYGELKKEGWGWGDQPAREVHHMPADSASNLERSEGPAIAMDYSDHQQTASCGSSRDAKEYRAKQRELIEEGKFREAVQMDIDDIKDKFGDKYDDAISQMLEHVDKLEEESKI